MATGTAPSKREARGRRPWKLISRMLSSARYVNDKAGQSTHDGSALNINDGIGLAPVASACLTLATSLSNAL